MPNYNIQEIYEEMEDNLIRSMKRNLGRHMDWEKNEGFSWEQWQAKKLREIRKFQRRNKQLAAVSRKKWKGFVQENLRKQFLEGGSKVDKEFSSAIKRGFSLRRGTPSDDFFEGENNKIKNLIKAVNDDFDKASYAALRKMDDVYRQTIFKSGMFGSSGVMTVNQAIDMATKDFLAKGIDCIVYKNGAKVNIASYASMAVRTANKRAHLMGEGERRKDWGETLVLVSQYLQCSPLCLPWQGKIYIDDVYSGGKLEDGPYPLLSTAIKGHLFHPNCRHTMSTYFEGINEVPEPLRNESGEAYEKAQEIANAKRQARKYERLKEGSLDPENVKKYKTKQKEWEERENSLRTGADVDYNVIWKIVKSKEYTERFSALSNNDIANKLAAKRSRNALANRAGKNTEELYAISLTSGKDISSITSQHNSFGVKRTKKFMSDIDRAEKNGERILLIHNHPKGSPPSIADLNELLSHKDAAGITVGHNGSIYYYSRPPRKITEFDKAVAIRKTRMYNGIEGDEEMMKELSKQIGFEFRKL